MDENKDALIVNAIELKPHKMYIRYLMAQRYSPGKIKSELVSLGLSAPSPEALERYFFTAVEPIIKKHKLAFLYAEYKNKMLMKGDKDRRRQYSMTINYKEEVMKDPSVEIHFLRFINELGVIEAFGPELLRLYGKVENVPNDPETGQSFTAKIKHFKEMPWDILDSPYRHIIEELLLQGVDQEGIISYMETSYNVRIRTKELSLYRRVFFSVERFDKTSQLRVMTAERENLLHDIKQVDNWIAESDRGVYKGDKSMSNLMQDRKSLYSRVSGLDATIKAVQAATSETLIKQNTAENDGYIAMFEDMIQTSYNKFKRFAQMNDRGVVDPLFKLTSMTQKGYDMLLKARENELKGKSMNQAQLINMITSRENELLEEQLREAEATGQFNAHNLLKGHVLDPDLIEGVEELLKAEEDAVDDGEEDNIDIVYEGE